MSSFFKNNSFQKNGQNKGHFFRGIILSIFWLFIWFTPWQNWIKSNVWLTIGIALGIFIAPGASLYSLLNQKGSLKVNSITIGFILSHLILALIGTAGRLFRFSFTYAMHIFMILGFLFIIINLFRNNNYTISQKLTKKKMAQLVSYWPLMLITILAALMTIQRVITSDDLAYLAHITNWQHMPTLDFFDVYFGADKLKSSRFWIVSTPYSQAFLSEFSRVPGIILLSGYYEPYLAIISILCMYDLARTLKFSQRSAITAVILQILFLALLSDYLHPGAPFFSQLSTDKATAAFIFSPVFILFAIQLLYDTRKETGIIFMLAGFSLSLLHPILAAYSVFIVSVISLFGTNQSNYKKHFIMIAASAFTLAPQIAVRLIQHEAQSSIPYSISNISQFRGLDNLVTIIEGTPFYGFNINILKMHIPYWERIPISPQIISWIWIAIPIFVAFAAIKNLKDSYIKQYILATILLILFAGNPITGWILGYFVSAWMLERTTWLYQFGISAVFLLLLFRNNTKIGKKLNSWRISSKRIIQINFTQVALPIIWIGSILLILLFMREQMLPNITRLENSTLRHQELSLVGRYFDENVSGPINVIGSDEINDFIPTLSWKAKVISYRPEDQSYPYFYSETEKKERWSDRQSLFSREVSPHAKMEIIQKYKISFILVENYNLGKFKDIMSEYPTTFTTHSFGRYSLIEIENHFQ